jgi:Outer membrane protein beta-barrel domain
MRARPWPPRFSLLLPLLMTLLLGSLAAPGAARADDPLGFYVGAAYGQAHVSAQLSGLTLNSAAPLGTFGGTRSAYQAMLGIRPISLLGAEITYMDFGQLTSGHPPRRAGPLAGLGPGLPVGQQASQKGEGVFALLYLPVPIIDVYLKAGMSRITTDATATYEVSGVLCQSGVPDCNIYSVGRSSTDTSFAYGTGVQWKLGDWALRGEYQRFSAAGEHPTLLSIGMTYWIPWG